jgi:hypothetical protein
MMQAAGGVGGHRRGARRPRAFVAGMETGDHLFGNMHHSQPIGRPLFCSSSHFSSGA